MEPSSKQNITFFQKLAYGLFSASIILIVVSMVITSVFPLSQTPEGGVLATEEEKTTAFDNNNEFQSAVNLLNSEWGGHPLDKKIEKAFLGTPGKPASDFLGLSEYLKKNGEHTYLESIDNFCESRPRFTDGISGPKLTVLTEDLSEVPVEISIKGDFQNVIHLKYTAPSEPEDGGPGNGNNIREILMNIPQRILSFFQTQKAAAAGETFTATLLSINQNLMFSSPTVTFTKTEDKEVDIEITLQDSEVSVGSTNVSLTFDSGQSVELLATDYPNIWRDGYAAMILMGDPTDSNDRGFGASEESFQQFYHNQILNPSFLEYMTPELYNLIHNQKIFSNVEQQYLERVFNGLSQKVTQCKRTLRASKTKMDELQVNRVQTFNISVAKGAALSAVATTSQSNSCNLPQDPEIGLSVTIPIGMINCVLRMEGPVGSVIRCVAATTLKILNKKLEMNEQIPIKCDYTDNIPFLIPNFKEQMNQFKQSVDIRKLYFLPRSQQEDFLNNSLPQFATQYIPFPGDETSKFFSKLLMITILKKIVVPKVLMPMLDNLNNLPVTDERNNVSVASKIDEKQAEMDSATEDIQTEVNAAATEELESVRKEAVERQLKALNEDQLEFIRQTMIQDFAIPTKEIRTIIGLTAKRKLGVNTFINSHSNTIEGDLAELVKTYEFPSRADIHDQEALINALLNTNEDPDEEEGSEEARIPVHLVQKVLDQYELVKTFMTPSLSDDEIDLKEGESYSLGISLDTRVKNLPVTFNLVNSQPNLMSVTPSTITFNSTNWNTPQIVVIQNTANNLTAPTSADVRLNVSIASTQVLGFQFNVIDGQTLDVNLLPAEVVPPDDGLNGPRQILQNILRPFQDFWKGIKAYAEDLFYQITFPQKDIQNISNQVVRDTTTLIEQTPVPETEKRFGQPNESQLYFKMPYALEDMAMMPKELAKIVLHELIRIPKADQTLYQKQQIDAIINYGARTKPNIIQDPLPKDFQ